MKSSLKYRSNDLNSTITDKQSSEHSQRSKLTRRPICRASYHLYPLRIPRLELIETKLFYIVKNLFDNLCPKYNPDDAKKCCLLLADSSIALSKSLKINRFKIVSHVNVIQKLGQSAMVSSKSLILPNIDRFISVAYEKNDFIVVCSVFVFYFD
jgi:hypothetical protein